jgi:threonine dehydrogenase-like Zn-dependent dehydrogenase
MPTMPAIRNAFDPLILGHELSGAIVGGPGVERRVMVDPLITCGYCEFCVRGRNNPHASRDLDQGRALAAKIILGPQ